MGGRVSTRHWAAAMLFDAQDKCKKGEKGQVRFSFTSETTLAACPLPHVLSTRGATR